MSIPGEEKLYEQRTLFSAEPYHVPRKVGDLDFEEWSKHPDIAYHGTAIGEYDLPFEQAFLHMGTQKAAEERLFGSGGPNQEHRYLDSTVGGFTPEYNVYDTDPEYIKSVSREKGLGPEIAGILERDQDIWEGYEDIGRYGDYRVRPFRMHEVMRDDQFSDSMANFVHLVAAAQSGTPVSPSIRESSTMEYQYPVRQKMHDLAEAVQAGQSMPYRNDLEDAGSTSYLVPRMGASTWEEDVINESNRSDRVKAFMQSRQGKFREGEMAPMQMRVGYQPTLDFQSAAETGTGEGHGLMAPQFGTVKRTAAEIHQTISRLTRINREEEEE